MGRGVECGMENLGHNINQRYQIFGKFRGGEGGLALPLPVASHFWLLLARTRGIPLPVDRGPLHKDRFQESSNVALYGCCMRSSVAGIYDTHNASGIPVFIDEMGLERAKGIEPSYAAWEAAVLPLNYARDRSVPPD
jgi:hypothetical protein